MKRWSARLVLEEGVSTKRAGHVQEQGSTPCGSLRILQQSWRIIKTMKHKEGWSIFLRILALLLIWAGLIFVFPIERGFASLRQASLAEKQGDYKAAIRALQEASRFLFWQREGILERAGSLALRADDASLAIILLEPLWNEHKLSLAGRFELAEAYARSGQKRAATRLQEELVTEGYRALELYPSLLQDYLSRRQYEQARAVLQELVDLQPKNAHWHYQLGILLAALRPEEAGTQLREAVKLDESYRQRVTPLQEQLAVGQKAGDRAVWFLYAGRGLAALGEWGLAEEAFEQAVKVRADYAEAWAYLGLAKNQLSLSQMSPLPGFADHNLSVDEQEMRKAQRYLAARSGLAEIQRALALDERSQAGLAFLTMYWQQRGLPHLALESAKKAAEFYPQDLNVLSQYAQALVLNGEMEKAWQVLLAARQTLGDTAAVRKTMVSFCIRNSYQLAETALPAARLLVYQYPGDVENLDLLAQVLFGLSYPERARQLLEHALRINPNYAPAYLHLGMISLSEGKYAQASEELRRAMELGGSTQIAENARRLLENYLP